MISRVLELIPVDDLHWNEEELRFTALSEKEIEKIILQGFQSGIEDVDKLTELVNYMSQMKIDGMLYQRFIDGKLKIQNFDNNELRLEPEL